MLSEIRQPQRSFGWLLLYEAPKTAKGIGADHRTVVTRGWGQGHRRLLFNGRKVTATQAGSRAPLYRVVPVLTIRCYAPNVLSR